MRLVIHAGFAHTDAWVIQAACNEARVALRAAGVCWPDLTALAEGMAHAELARAALRDDFDAVDRLVGHLAMQGIVQGTHTVLLSSEEFAALGAEPARLQRLRLHVLECFDDIGFVALSRSLGSLTRMQVRQALLHFGYDVWATDNRAGRMAQYVIAQQAKLKDALGDALHVHSYERMIASGSFCDTFLHACVPELGDAQVLAERAAAGAPARLDPYGTFGALVRAAVAKLHHSPPYSPLVQAELERMLPRAALEGLVAVADMPAIEQAIAALLDDAANEAVAAFGDWRAGELGARLSSDLADALAQPADAPSA